jgi:hypothetical protein
VRFSQELDRGWSGSDDYIWLAISIPLTKLTIGGLTRKQDCFRVLAITLNHVSGFLQAGTDLLIGGSDGGRREIPFGKK